MTSLTWLLFWSVQFTKAQITKRVTFLGTSFSVVYLVPAGITQHEVQLFDFIEIKIVSVK